MAGALGYFFWNSLIAVASAFLTVTGLVSFAIFSYLDKAFASPFLVNAMAASLASIELANPWESP